MRSNEGQLIDNLIAEGPVLLDGAWGTELQARGLSLGEVPDHWNVTQPARVREVARAYVKAGSRVILTNTFRANYIALGLSTGNGYVRELNRKGVEISRDASSGSALVFASIGPTGKLLLAGEVAEDDLKTAFKEQALALAEGGADAIVIETMSDLQEARLALQAAKQTDLPVVVCMVFDSGKSSDRTMMGVRPEQAVEELSSAGADVIGANCGTGIEAYVPICRRMREATKRPIWMKPNAGVPSIVDGKTVYHTTPHDFADSVLKLVAAGANFVGGCCGSTPEFIQTTSRLLDSRSH
jgi:methionine synthase I (cobalamin-dependent)